MGSNGDDLQFPYDGAAGDENSWNLSFSPVITAVVNSTLVDSLVARNDPRLPKMVLPAVLPVYIPVVKSVRYREPDSYSYPADFYGAPDAYNHIVSYSEPCLCV